MGVIEVIKPLRVKEDSISQGKVREILEEEEEARKNRVREADWYFISSQQQKIASALLELVKTGDLLRCAKMAEVSPLELDKLRERAGIYHL